MRHMRAWVLLGWLGFPSIAVAQGATADTNTIRSYPSKTEAQQRGFAGLLEGKVRGAWAAFKARDKEKYAAFLTDDFQAVEADGGGERAKSQILREVEHSMYTDYLIQLLLVQQFGQKYALVTYEVTLQFPANSAIRYKRLFIGELWIDRNSGWKMMRYQETPVR